MGVPGFSPLSHITIIDRVETYEVGRKEKLKKGKRKKHRIVVVQEENVQRVCGAERKRGANIT